MANAIVNKWIDLLDRVAWTAIQAFAGAMIVTGLNDWSASLGIAGIAAAIAALKTIVGQNIGKDGAGDLVPTQSIIK
jgi:hypothetical protein